MANEVATVSPGPLMSFIERAAVNPQFDVAKFGELLKLQREEEHNQARRAFNHAMARAQAEMQPVVRGAVNKHLGNKYAKLEDIDAVARPIYTKYGLSVRFGSAPAPEGFLRVTCTVAHDGGYFEENALDAPLTATGSQGGKMAMTPQQALGSASTYLRKYLECMVFNIVFGDDENDDDGEGTRQRNYTTHEARPARGEGTPLTPDPKAVAWKDRTVELMAQVQTEGGLKKLWSEIKATYESAKQVYPDLAAEVTAADLAARTRIHAATAFETPRPGVAPFDPEGAEAGADTGATP